MQDLPIELPKENTEIVTPKPYKALSSFSLSNFNSAYSVGVQAGKDGGKSLREHKANLLLTNHTLNDEKDEQEIKALMQRMEASNRDVYQSAPGDIFREEEKKDRVSRIEQHLKFTSDNYNLNPDIYSDPVKLYELMSNESFDDIVMTVDISETPGEKLKPREYSKYIDDYNESTFKSNSIWNILGDRKAEIPQINELLSTNAQTLKYFAIRMRGGLNGELWEKASLYLQEQFKESPEMKERLDTWVNISPTALSLEASTTSPYWSKNPFELLNEAEIPSNLDDDPTNDWDPKRAWEELEQSKPNIFYALTVQMGITKERMMEPDVSKNPQIWKMAIANAIDAYAFGKISEEFDKQHNAFNRQAFGVAFPMLRDSINSNDTMAEFALIGAGLAMSATGVLAPVGVSAAAVGTVSLLSKAIRLGVRTSRVARNALRLSRSFDRSRTLLRMSHKLRKVGSSIAHFAPHNIGEALLKGAAKNKKIGWLLYVPKEVAEEAAERTVKGFGSWASFNLVQTLPRYVARSLINGAAQGAVEDTIRQRTAINNEFASEFSWSTMGQNMIEEGVGEVLLGGFMNIATSPISTFNLKGKIKIDFLDTLDTKMKSSRQIAIDKTWGKLNYATRDRLTFYAGLISGVDYDNPNLTVDQQVDMRLGAYALREAVHDVDNVTGLGDILDPKNSNPLIRATLSAMTNTDVNDKTDNTESARLTLLGKLHAVIQRYKNPSDPSNLLVAEDFWGALFSIGVEASTRMKNDSSQKMSLNRLISGFWGARQTKKEDGTMPDISEATDAEIDELAKEMQQRVEDFGVKILGGKENIPKDKDGNLIPMSNLTADWQPSQDLLDTLNKEAQRRANETGKPVSINGSSGTPGLAQTAKPAAIADDTPEPGMEMKAGGAPQVDPDILFVSPIEGITFVGLGPDGKVPTYDVGGIIKLINSKPPSGQYVVMAALDQDEESFSLESQVFTSVGAQQVQDTLIGKSIYSESEHKIKGDSFETTFTGESIFKGETQRSRIFPGLILIDLTGNPDILGKLHSSEYTSSPKIIVGSPPRRTPTAPSEPSVAPAATPVAPVDGGPTEAASAPVITSIEDAEAADKAAGVAVELARKASQASIDAARSKTLSPDELMALLDGLDSDAAGHMPKTDPVTLNSKTEDEMNKDDNCKIN